MKPTANVHTTGHPERSMSSRAEHVILSEAKDLSDIKILRRYAPQNDKSVSSPAKHVILSGRTRAGGTRFVRRVSTKRQREAKDLAR